MSAVTWSLATAAAFVVLAASFELAARWWLRHRSGYYVFPPGLRIDVKPDPEACPGLDRSARFEINRDGERGDEPPRSSRGLYRILVAGGSIAECYLLDQDASWSGALQRLLEQPESRRRLGASRVHVGNISHSGIGAEGVDQVLERVLPRYDRLQAIIVLLGVSDVSHWLELEAPPCSPPSSRVCDLFRCHPEQQFGWQPRQLAATELLVRLRRRWLHPMDTHERAGGWMVKARAMRARAKETRTVVPDPAPMLDHFERHLRRIIERARRHADRVIVMRQSWIDEDYTPEEEAQMWHGGVGTVWREEVTTFYSLPVFSRLMWHLDTRAAEVAREMQVEQLDLMSLLDRRVETYYDGFHLTPTGARAVAGALAALILRESQQSEAAPRRLRPSAVA